MKLVFQEWNKQSRKIKPNNNLSFSFGFTDLLPFKYVHVTMRNVQMGSEVVNKTK